MSRYLARAAGLLLACWLSSVSAQTMEQLRAMLAERDATIAELRQQLVRAGVMVEVEPPAVAVVPGDRRALERALVREGGALLAPGVWEAESSLGYAHDAAMRQTGYEAAIGWRVGLPWHMQLDGTLPYEHQAGGGSRWGGARLGLTADLTPERSRDAVGLLAWVSRQFPSGMADAGVVAAGFGLTQRQDPLVISSSLDLWRPQHRPQSSTGLNLRQSMALALAPERSLSVSLDIGRMPHIAETDLPAVHRRGYAILSLALNTALTPQLLVNVGISLRVMGQVPNVRLFAAFPLRN